MRTRASPNDHRLHTSDNTEYKEDDKMLADHSEEKNSNIQSSFCFTCTLPSSKAQNIQLLLCQSVRCASKSEDVLCFIFKILLVYYASNIKCCRHVVYLLSTAQCVLCKVYFSAQPNKLRPILKFKKYYPIEHIFVPACSSARKIHFF